MFAEEHSGETGRHRHREKGDVVLRRGGRVGEGGRGSYNAEREGARILRQGKFPGDKRNQQTIDRESGASSSFFPGGMAHPPPRGKRRWTAWEAVGIVRSTERGSAVGLAMETFFRTASGPIQPWLHG
jgi:hypothetical protein